LEEGVNEGVIMLFRVKIIGTVIVLVELITTVFAEKVQVNPEATEHVTLVIANSNGSVMVK
jgi:hypothetical protein